MTSKIVKIFAVGMISGASLIASSSISDAATLARPERPKNGSAAASPPTVASTVAPEVSMGASSRPPDGRWAPYAGGPTANLVSGSISAGGCTYQQANDDPHFSSTAGDVSMHAWWIYAGGVCPSKSTVTGGLQAYFCSSLFGCNWVTVTTDVGSYLPGGGSGRRATPRITCAGSGTVGWQGWTDVDLPGINDPSAVTYSTIVNLGCSPP